jgi:hypothetical protein
MDEPKKIEISPSVLILIIVALVAFIGVMAWTFLRPPAYAPSPGVVDGGPQPGNNPNAPGYIPPSPGGARPMASPGAR